MAAAVAPLRDVTVGQQASLVYAVGASMTASLVPLFEAAEAMPAVRDVSIAQTTLEDVFIQVRRPPGGGGGRTAWRSHAGVLKVGRVCAETMSGTPPQVTADSHVIETLHE